MDRQRVVVVELAEGQGRGSGYVIAPRTVLTSAHVVSVKGTRVTVFRPSQARVYTAVVVWRGTPGGKDDAALLRLDDPDWVPPEGRGVRWGRLVTRRTRTPLESWGAADAAQRPGSGVDTLQPSGTINPGDWFVANRYVMSLDQYPPDSSSDGVSPWGGMSGAALFGGGLLVGVITSDQRGFAHSRLAAVPAYLLWKDEDFRAALAKHAPETGTGMEAVELQHLVDAMPHPMVSTTAGLLNPRRAVVTFDNRTQALDKLYDWAKSPGPAAHVLHGPRGQGKTRLSHKLAEMLSDDAWAIARLRADALAPEALAVLEHVVTSLLVVIDNADARVPQVRGVVEALARHSGSKAVKLLLLTRTGTDGDWWRVLRTGSSTVGEFLDGAVLTLLPALAPDLDGRREVYWQAVEAFARRLPQVSGREQHDWPAIASGLSPPNLDEPGLDNARTLHTTALTDLLQAAGASRQEINALWSRDAPQPYDPNAWQRYLHAAQAAAASHPYPQILADHFNAPSLAAVYLRQRARPETPGRDRASVGAGEGAPSPAEQVLERQGNSVVLAPAGGGKTCLLRSVLAAAVGRRLSGQEREHGRAVPVLVQAADLVGRSLPTAIAASVLNELSEDFPSDFFRSRPLQGVPWLVLVDGLDEIANVEDRRKVLDLLARHISDSVTSPYRFVIATRPMEEGLLSRLGKKVVRYDLMPFESDELRLLAERWFTALDLRDPKRAVESLMSKLAHTQLAELARTPLMAAILCQLHADTPGRALPKGRSEVYREFTDLLHRRRRAGGPPLKDIGDPRLTAAAQRAWTHLTDLLSRLAAEWHSGRSQSAVEWLAAQPEAACPVEEMRREWSQFLTECLRRSGLLTQRGRKFVFIHETILEYLAARHTAHDKETSSKAFKDLFERDLFSSDEARSYTGFLLDAWSQTEMERTVRTALHRLAVKKRARGRGHAFIAQQVNLGTLLPHEVTSAVADHLAAEAARGASRDTGTNAAWAARYLVMLGDPRGREAFAALAFDDAVNVHTRQWAANDLAGLNDPRGAQALQVLASDSALKPDERVRAASRLTDIDPSHALDVLTALALDTSLPTYDRQEASKVLGRLGDPRGAQTLTALVDDTALEGYARVSAAKALASCGAPYGFEALVAFATTPSNPAVEQQNRLFSLMEEHYQSTGNVQPEDLNAFVDAGLERKTPRDAALALAELGDPRGLSILKAMSDDPTADSDFSDVVEAAQRLHAAGRPEGTDTLAALVSDPSELPPHRQRAADALARLGDRRGFDFLAGLAEDSSTPTDLRLITAQFLAGLYDKRGPDALASIAKNEDLGYFDRLRAAEFLDAMCDHRAQEALTAVREAPDAWPKRDWFRAIPDWDTNMPDLPIMESAQRPRPVADRVLDSIDVVVNWDTLEARTEIRSVLDE